MLNQTSLAENVQGPKPVITPGPEQACANTFKWCKALCGHAMIFDMANIHTRVPLNDGLCRTVVTARPLTVYLHTDHVFSKSFL
ncbi:unnamed protein product [Brassica rapa]|uniref:Uncharacterized protein n=1 Tax=Brassica campestris TaxID=3711 RepID=A0A8D9I5Q3_BRACM|nr:unnamed protein product [Brassica rapa]